MRRHTLSLIILTTLISHADSKTNSLRERKNSLTLSSRFLADLSITWDSIPHSCLFAITLSLRPELLKELKHYAKAAETRPLPPRSSASHFQRSYQSWLDVKRSSLSASFMRKTLPFRNRLALGTTLQLKTKTKESGYDSITSTT